MQILETKHLRCSVSSLGAELQSLLLKANSEELIWQGDPTVWSGRAPILFPIVGALRHSPAHHEKGPITLAKHGFARTQSFSLIDHGKNFARYSLQSSNATLEYYPWHFELQVYFELTPDSLLIHYQVHNKDESALLFNLGSHPAFRLPLQDSALSDYSIHFDKAEDLSLYSVTADGLLDPCPVDYKLENGQIELSDDIFNNDALVFRNIRSTQISLAHQRLGTRLSVDTGGAPHLGIWAKPGAEFVCIEPWWGHADFSNASDAFAEKASIQSLPAKEIFSSSIEIHPVIANGVLGVM